MKIRSKLNYSLVFEGHWLKQSLIEPWYNNSAPSPRWMQTIDWRFSRDNSNTMADLEPYWCITKDNWPIIVVYSGENPIGCHKYIASNHRSRFVMQLSLWKMINVIRFIEKWLNRLTSNHFVWTERLHKLYVLKVHNSNGLLWIVICKNLYYFLYLCLSVR